MKKLAVLLILPFLVCGTGQKHTVIFSIGDWYPYTSEGGGLAIAIVKMICAQANIDCVFEYAPWKRCESNVIEGLSFGTFPYSATEERKQKYLLSDPIFAAKSIILWNSSSRKISRNTIKNASDLKGLKIGITVGSDPIIAILKKAGALVEETQTIDFSLKKLEMNRIDLLIEDYYVVQNLLHITKSESIAIYNDGMAELFPIRDYRVLVSRKYPDSQVVLAAFNRSLNQVRDTKEFNDLLATYIKRQP